MSQAHTTYFAKVKTLPQDLNFISIARKTPPGFPGKAMPELMPSSALLWAYKNKEVSEEEYTVQYMKQLDKLDPAEISRRAGNNPVYVCYEGKGSFCHRHLLSGWLEKNGVSVSEI